jgi:hypothetical protein
MKVLQVFKREQDFGASLLGKLEKRVSGGLRRNIELGRSGENDGGYEPRATENQPTKGGSEPVTTQAGALAQEWGRLELRGTRGIGEPGDG